MEMLRVGVASVHLWKVSSIWGPVCWGAGLCLSLCVYMHSFAVCLVCAPVHVGTQAAMLSMPESSTNAWGPCSSHGMAAYSLCGVGDFPSSLDFSFLPSLVRFEILVPEICLLLFAGFRRRVAFCPNPFWDSVSFY